MKCGTCGSERLSPLAELSATGGERHIRPLLLFRRPGFFRPRPSYHAERARACLDCGAVIPFLAEHVRRQLVDEVDTVLEVVDEEPGQE
jgi:hypothetical protein